MANAVCERLIGTIRRECLTGLMPTSEPHLRCLLKKWGSDYHRGRLHLSHGPSVSDPPAKKECVDHSKSRNLLGEHLMECGRSVLDGLHHEYSLEAV